ncbi:hypothetical protein V8D89_004898 [Ganoderma adspersum]
MAALDPAAVIGQISYLNTDDRIFAGASALVLFEYLITFGAEVQLFWRRKLTGASILFFFNRYTRLLLISILLSESSELTCFGGFSALRVFALTGGNWFLPPIVFMLSLAPLAVNFATWYWMTFVNDPIYGCLRELEGLSDALYFKCPEMILATASRSALNHNHPTFSGLLLRDGTLYFIVMVSMNVLQLAFSTSPDPGGIYVHHSASSGQDVHSYEARIDAGLALQTALRTHALYHTVSMFIQTYVSEFSSPGCSAAQLDDYLRELEGNPMDAMSFDCWGGRPRTTSPSVIEPRSHTRHNMLSEKVSVRETPWRCGGDSERQYSGNSNQWEVEVPPGRGGAGIASGRGVERRQEPAGCEVVVPEQPLEAAHANVAQYRQTQEPLEAQHRGMREERREASRGLRHRPPEREPVDRVEARQREAALWELRLDGGYHGRVTDGELVELASVKGYAVLG